MKLWKDNKINQEWELKDITLISKFKHCLKHDKKIQDIRDYRSTEYAFRYFITSKEYLNSSFEESDFQALFKKHRQELIYYK